ncbi:MAG: hypothetical protein ACRDBO_12025 [Lachnospiraceae bacterium]
MMKKRILGILLVLTVSMAGCGESTSEERDATNGGSTVSVEDTMSKETGKDEFDYEAEFLDLRIGDTVCVESSAPGGKLQYKVTLNAVEYSESEINGLDGEGDDFIILDLTLEGVGPDVSYGVILTQLYLGRSVELAPELQELYGLNTFANAEDMLTAGEVVTGKLAARYPKTGLTVEKRGMLTTKYTYTVDESEIKDYVPGEQ